MRRTSPDGESVFDWDSEGRMRSATGPGGTELYYYDHAGSRMLTVNPDVGIRFWFAESETHFDRGGTQVHRYLDLSNNGNTVARVEDATHVELQYADALQNLMLSLDEQGSANASFLYGAFGEIVRSTGQAAHGRQFNGKESDTTTGLRYYGFRYYDPLALRWNSADPMYRFTPEVATTKPQRANLYAFALNNPLRYFDPDALDAGDEGNKVANPWNPFDWAEYCQKNRQECEGVKKLVDRYCGDDLQSATCNFGLMSQNLPPDALDNIRWSFGPIPNLVISILRDEPPSLDRGFGAGRIGGGGGNGSPGNGRGGASAPKGIWTPVSRWMSVGEASQWKGRSSMPQPRGNTALTVPRTYVTEYGAPRPGGTGPIRVDFEVPTTAIQPGGNSQWFQIFNEGRSVPIRELRVNP